MIMGMFLLMKASNVLYHLIIIGTRIRGVRYSETKCWMKQSVKPQGHQSGLGLHSGKLPPMLVPVESALGYRGMRLKLRLTNPNRAFKSL
jgi:hypothetical protein